ncbi:uncharacterized protein MELLADRAFT_95104 [Melampsora larici-populina 98AG31]|uniref:F-box domain-containing protein n=1 Tax=Melampsora larici-populina (strain 98AG31 / pathotype 3-4-7) TaxID=747676 RepID=F4RCN9_MELLP|nr:uncharacterized protein MELLADRAFT_95104 [Melampsora larici-populina 98AG31]EGG10015.1 hypothetical protein MELLADRAFT_95104 [Melampsora larici-populina 98AG31]
MLNMKTSLCTRCKTQALCTRCTSGIASEACSIEVLCRIPSIAKDLTQLKRTGENFSLWERELKVMIRNLSGSSDYLQHEFNKYDPRLNQAVFNLIFWSIDKELQHAINIDGSAGEAFQFLTDRFQSAPSTQCIMNRVDLPEEILDNIVNIIYLYSTKEDSTMRRRKNERITWDENLGQEEGVSNQLPPLTTFQSLAVVNRKYHRLCLPRMWQKLWFPTSSPEPLSRWTEGLLLNHGRLVKTFKFELEDLLLIDNAFGGEFRRSTYDNQVIPETLEDLTLYLRCGIGLMNIQKIFNACPRLESVSMDIREKSYLSQLSSPMKSRLIGLFGLIPQLQHLDLWNLHWGLHLPGEFVIDVLKELPSLVALELRRFQFVEKSSIEESLGWNLAQLQNLRKLRLEDVTCKDQTWNLNSWPRQLTSLEIYCRRGLTPVMVHNLLSGSAPCLTRLRLQFDYRPEESDVDILTDLPALKQLILGVPGFSLTSFKGCKNIESIDYKRIMNSDRWDMVKHILCTYPWPKLSVLNLYTTTIDSPNNWRRLDKKDVDEIWDAFNIKLLISTSCY